MIFFCKGKNVSPENRTIQELCAAEYMSDISQALSNEGGRAHGGGGGSLDTLLQTP